MEDVSADPIISLLVVCTVFQLVDLDVDERKEKREKEEQK